MKFLSSYQIAAVQLETAAPSIPIIFRTSEWPCDNNNKRNVLRQQNKKMKNKINLEAELKIIAPFQSNKNNKKQ